VGKLGKQIIKRKMREQAKLLRSGLRGAGHAQVAYLCTPLGAPLMRTEERGHTTVNVTWAFSCRDHRSEEPLALREQLVEENDGKEVGVSHNPVLRFIGDVLTHLTGSDLDILAMDGEREFPLTTIGVSVLGDEKWAKLLVDTRKSAPRNPLLCEVIRQVLITASPEDEVVITKASDEEITQLIVGKKERFALPGVDMGIIWMMTSRAKGEEHVDFEPIFLRLKDSSPDNPTEEDLAIGPLFFTHREHAMAWPQVLPPDIAVSLAKMDIHLEAYRSIAVLEEINQNFPVARVEEDQPDVFLLDGGCLPMTVAGARYTDERAYGEDKPERSFTTIAEESIRELQRAVVMLAAQAMGIQVQVVENPAEDEPAEDEPVEGDLEVPVSPPDYGETEECLTEGMEE